MTHASTTPGDDPTDVDVDEVAAPCSATDTPSEFVVEELDGPKRFYSIDGYAARWLRIERQLPDGAHTHCVLVAWPSGRRGPEGRAVRVAAAVHQGWLRAIENTLERVPWQHAILVRRLVIDNRPTEHGIAPFDRQSPDDGRDGHTIWLHEHLFMQPNHWARGNHGSYWSYHASEDGVTLHSAPIAHELFSPVLLHELGHLVMYHLVNEPAVGIAATSAPPCAQTCGESGGCMALEPKERERGCISPYCMPFRFKASTENWAEQYRFFYQGSSTRELLGEAGVACVSLLHEHDHGALAPWLAGQPDMPRFRPSMWNSCGGKPCKRW